MTRSSELHIKPLLAAALIGALAACSSGPPQRPPAPRAAVQPAATVAAAPKPTADKGDPDQRFKAALQLMKNKQPQEARAAFSALARDFPNLSGPLTDLGILYAQGRQRDQALAHFSQAVNANPKNAVALNWLGSLYRESGNHARAEESYRKALAARPDYAPAHLNLGILYDVSMKRPQDALREYREYQRLAGKEKPIVAVWIKELEASTGAAVASNDSAVATP